jgi:hypothetical protein
MVSLFLHFRMVVEGRERGWDRRSTSGGSWHARQDVFNLKVASAHASSSMADRCGIHVAAEKHIVIISAILLVFLNVYGITQCNSLHNLYIYTYLQR